MHTFKLDLKTSRNAECMLWKNVLDFLCPFFCNLNRQPISTLNRQPALCLLVIFCGSKLQAVLGRVEGVELKKKKKKKAYFRDSHSASGKDHCREHYHANLTQENIFVVQLSLQKYNILKKTAKMDRMLDLEADHSTTLRHTCIRHLCKWMRRIKELLYHHWF